MAEEQGQRLPVAQHVADGLDNNVCERALKMAILHRKNSLSYKTLNGARIGDLFMSLIHTCRLNRVSPFAYLLALATHPEEVKLQPSAWLPWNYPNAETVPALDHDPPGQPAGDRSGAPRPGRRARP